MSPPPEPFPSLTFCVYGDSIVMDRSPTGNQTEFSEGKGVCDWCDPLVDAGIAIISMGRNGAEADSDSSDPISVDDCDELNPPNYRSNCEGSGEAVALTDDTTCPGTEWSSSCRDVRGDTDRDSTYMDDIAPFCDVFGFFFGTNDTAENLTTNEFDLVHQAVIEKAAALKIPVIFWEAIPTFETKARHARLAEYRAEIQAAITAVTYAERRYVSVYSGWDLFEDIRVRFGDYAQRCMYDDAPSGWSQSEWDSGSNQTGDFTHPERSVINCDPSPTGTVIPADYLGRAIRNHVLSVHSGASSRREVQISTVVISKPLYYVDQTLEEIHRADVTNGANSNIELLLTDASGAGLGRMNYPQSVAVDYPGGKFYFVDAADKHISRANLDGSGYEELITSPTNMVGPSHDIKLDLVNRKMYWNDHINSGGTIRRANMDGTPASVVASIENIEGSSLLGDGHLAIDAAGVMSGNVPMLYWMTGNGKIRRKPLSDTVDFGDPGSQGVELISSGISGPKYMDLDLVNEKIYWAEYSGNVIARCDPDEVGGGSAEIEDWVTGLNNPSGIAVDVGAAGDGYVYWSSFGDDKIKRKPISAAAGNATSNVEDIITTGLSSPTGVAIASP